MNHPFLSISLFLFASSLYAQDLKRTEVSGKLIAVNEVEGVTIFNSTSRKGTVANSQGFFILEVALNDILEISALQYESNTVIVNQDVMDSRLIRLFLVDKVNALNEVLLLSSQLSGNLLLDMKNVKEAKKMEINFGNLSELEFPEDEFTKVDNKIIKKDQLTDGLNVASILGINKLINRPKKKRSLPQEEVSLEKKISVKYPPSFFIQNYKIPSHQADAFIHYVVSNGFTENLLEENEYFMLLEFLQIQSLEFLKQEHE